VELNAQEVQEVEGGFVLPWWFDVSLTAGLDLSLGDWGGSGRTYYS